MSRKKITLSASEVTALKTKALAQVEAERKKEAENELLAKLVQEARAEFDSNEEMIEHEILLPLTHRSFRWTGGSFITARR